MRRRRSLPLLFAALPLGAVLALSAAANADTVGTAGAVNTTSSGTAPGAPARVIEIGAQVVVNEKIQTTATGSVQVLFIDKTTLNVGPNSTLVIDRFVYNPATTKGELALSLGKGVMRVVGGVATHSEGATIRTPVAAIGLRGGIAIISHSSAKGTQAILGFGRMSVTSLCGGSDCHPTTTDVTRPGYSVTVGFNRLPSSPSRVSSQELALASSQLTSQKGQSGGASQQPTDNQARTYNVGTPTSPGAPMIQTASAGRANALTAANAMGQTVAQGAQNSASVKTAQRVVAQDLLKPVIPPVIPPVVRYCPDYARRAGSHRDLCDCHPRAFHHQHGPELRTLSHRRLRRKRRLPRLADPRLSKWGLQSGRHAGHNLKTVPSRPQRDRKGSDAERDAVCHDIGDQQRAQRRLYPGRRVHRSDDAQSRRMVRAGRRLRVVGDARRRPTLCRP